MARASFSDIKPLANSVLTQNDYILNLGVVPGSGYTQSQEALLKCVKVTLPAIEIETLPVEMHGYKVVHRGIKKFGDNQFSCEFLVSGDTSLLGYNADSFQLIYNWMNLISDTREGFSQSGKSILFSGLQGMTQGVTGKLIKSVIGNVIPNVSKNGKQAYCLDNVALNVYNTKGDLTLKISLDGVFPILLEGIDLSNSQVDKQVMRLRVVFAFDTYEASDIASTKILSSVNKLADKLITKVNKKLPSSVKKLSRLL